MQELHTALRIRQVALHLAVNLTVIFAIALASFGLMSAASNAFAQTAGQAAGQAADTMPVIKASFVRPNDMNMGALLLPSTRPGQYVEAPRLATDVDIAGEIVEEAMRIARASAMRRLETITAAGD